MNESDLDGSHTPQPASYLTLKILFRMLVLPAFILILSGCSDSPAGPDDENDAPGVNEVLMTAHSFTPGNKDVIVGSTVVWKNTSSENHTVTSGAGGQPDGRFDSGNIPPGGEYTFTFTESGSYPYYCIPHLGSGMIGTITVIASGGGDNGDDDGY